MELIQRQKGNLQAAMQNRLLTPEEVAEILGVTVGTLQVWRSTKRYPLPYVKVGRKTMYPPAGLKSFIESRTIAA